MKRYWVEKVCTLEPHRESTMTDSREKKEARRCEPDCLRFDLTVLFSLDPPSSVLSFSF
jgi:hypothetical protein